MLDCQVDLLDTGRTQVLRPVGELDLANAEDLSELAMSVITSSGASELVIDLRCVAFLDSSALGALVTIRNRAGARDCSVRVENATGRVAALFKITGLDEAFSVA